MNSIWICLPTYNEAENLERMISALNTERLNHSLNINVLIIDDNSPDGTGDIANNLVLQHSWVHVLHRTNKNGLGKAYIEGFNHAIEAKADFIMEMDCDFSHDPKDVKRLIEACSDSDLVIGSRNISGGGVTGWPWYRNFISKGGSFYARTILNLKIKDMTAGFTLFRRKVLEHINLENIEASGYMFQIELKYQTSKAGFRIKEIPVTFIDREFGESKMSTNIVLEAIWRVWKLRFKRK